ncbi:MAG TPA: CHRD domain-containing protein, partial [Phnomibacter sp.]|nr:CHRD domain-containing protein [Phnomibacter sp.]
APVGRLDQGTGRFILYADNRLDYNVQTNTLQGGDRISGAAIHSGDAGTNGPVVLTLDVGNGEGNAFGGVANLTAAQADIITGKTPGYLSVRSNRAPNGLMRVQFDDKVTWAKEGVAMGSGEWPVVNTPARGNFWFRLTEAGILYSNISVSGLPAGDAITMAHIHTGARRTNGPVSINLFPAGASDLGKTVKITLTAAQRATLTGGGAIYLNVHSTRFPGGIVRYQIRG